MAYSTTFGQGTGITISEAASLSTGAGVAAKLDINRSRIQLH
ncbi:MAG: hypothetical protein ACSNEK_08170 [Parachlamydiaceae bacterium]